MKFGITLRPIDRPSEIAERASVIERLGFHYFWLADPQLVSWDTIACLTLCATRTSRISLGTNILSPAAQQPALATRSLATLDSISNGRAMMGIGRGAHPLRELALEPASGAAIRDMIRVTRRLLAGEIVDDHGPSWQLQGANLRRRFRSAIPIYVAGTGPKTLRLAGEIADGAIMNVGADPACICFALENVRAGGKVDEALFLYYLVDEDRDQALALCRSSAFELLSTTAHYPLLVGMSPDETRRLRDDKRAREERAKLIGQEQIDRAMLCGTVPDVVRKLDAISALGIRHVEIFPIGVNLDEQIGIFATQILPHFG